MNFGHHSVLKISSCSTILKLKYRKFYHPFQCSFHKLILLCIKEHQYFILNTFHLPCRISLSVSFNLLISNPVETQMCRRANGLLRGLQRLMAVKFCLTREVPQHTKEKLHTCLGNGMEAYQVKTENISWFV